MALLMPPCTRWSACSSPSIFSWVTCLRSTTGNLKKLVRTVLPFHSISFGRPTLREISFINIKLSRQRLIYIYHTKVDSVYHENFSTMKKILIVSIGMLFISSVSLGQTDSLQKQINEQVWKPFIHTFNNRDEAGFRAVHSQDVVRVEQDG